MGVEQPEHDDVIALRRQRLEGVARVVDDHVDAGIVIGALRMMLTAHLDDRGIDIDGIDMLGAGPKRGCHVVPGSGADHQNAIHARTPGELGRVVGEWIMADPRDGFRSQVLGPLINRV
jgi:hypothetical protein